MKNIYQFSFEDDMTDDDDIDEVFSQLEHFTPPADFVDRVMNTISQLPLPQYLSPAPKLEGEHDGLVIHREHMQPS